MFLELRGRSRCKAGFLGIGLLACAAVASADPQAPAYLIEPGDAPANSAPLDPNPSADPNAPAAAAPVQDAPQTDGDDSTYDPSAAPPPAATAPVPPQAPDATQPAQTGGADDDDPRALDEFAPRLDPYGTWTDDPSYGTVWTPEPSIVGTGFSPYLTSGHWVMDPTGNRSWVSDYPFGDIVFHYGRWVWATHGWAWIPGYRYAAAWVAWRVPTDAYAYYGWSPLPPDFVWVNRGAAALSWRSSYYWVFCPTSFVFSASPRLYVVHSTADARSLAFHTRTYFPAVPRRSATNLAISSTRIPRNAVMRGPQFSNAMYQRSMAPRAPASVPHAAPRPMRGAVGPAPHNYGGGAAGGSHRR